MKALFVASSVILPLFAACGETAEVAPKNLILISLDTLRPDRLGCYGDSRATSPHLDRFAEEGVLFEDVSSAAPWTLPAHATMFTGVYPREHGVKAFEHKLEEDHPTLATRLAAAGFRTMAVVNSILLSEMNGLDQGVEQLEYVSEFKELPGGGRRIVSSAAGIVERAKALISDAGEKPFFLFLHFYDTHSDFAPEPHFKQGLIRPYKGPADGSTAQLLAIRRDGVQLRDIDARHFSDLYDAEIRQLDERLSVLLDFIEASGLYEDTLVIITSDHGEEFMEHGSVLHGRTYYEEVIRIPLLMRGAGVPRGVRVEEAVSLVDIAPTVLSLLEQPYVPLDGEDLSDRWKGGTQGAQRYLFAEGDHGLARNDVRRMVRHGNHKLCFDALSGQPQLFDLAADPEEKNDLAAGRPALVRELMGRLEEHMAGARAGTLGEGPSAQTLQHLGELGYTSADDD